MENARAPLVTQVATGEPRHRRRWRDVLAPYMFILPFVLFFLVLFLGPAAYSFVLSFFRFKGYGQARFLGLSNYKAILGYHVFWTTLKNTLFYWLAHVVPLMSFAFLLALVIRSKLIAPTWKSIYKPAIYLPNIVAAVASALIFQSIFGTKYGVLNNLLGTEIPWLQDMALVRYVVVILLVWRGVGRWCIIYLAGLTSINPELEEAALVDGATGWQRLRFVILPLMRGTFLFALVMDAISSFRLFTEPNVLVSRGGALAPPDVAPMLNLLLSNLRSARFGASSAVGWVLFILVVVISYIQFRIMRES